MVFGFLLLARGLLFVGFGANERDMKSQALWMRLRDEKWDDYEVSSGSAQRLEKVLQDLASRKRARSMKACHEVWKLLCNGGVRSAAIIAVPYLVDIIDISTKDVQMEIADIIRDCAVGATKNSDDWVTELKQVILIDKSTMEYHLKKAKGDAVIAWATCVDAVSELE